MSVATSATVLQTSVSSGEVEVKVPSGGRQVLSPLPGAAGCGRRLGWVRHGSIQRTHSTVGARNTPERPCT